MSDPARRATLSLLEDSTHGAPTPGNGHRATINFGSSGTSLADATRVQQLLLQDMERRGITVTEASVRGPQEASSLHGGRPMTVPPSITFRINPEHAERLTSYFKELEAEIHAPGSPSVGGPSPKGGRTSTFPNTP
jgi:hypothetical protein